MSQKLRECWRVLEVFDPDPDPDAKADPDWTLFFLINFQIVFVEADLYADTN